MEKLILSIIGLVVSCLLVYFIYWLTKTVSYHIFYEGMVQQTITEMVKAGALK